MKKYAVIHKTEKINNTPRWAVSTHDGRLIATVRKVNGGYFAVTYGTKSYITKLFSHLRPIVQWAIDNENK